MAHPAWIAFKDGEAAWKQLDSGLNRWEIPVMDQAGRYQVAWVDKKETDDVTVVWVVTAQMDLDSTLEVNTHSLVKPAPETVVAPLKVVEIPDNRWAWVECVGTNGELLGGISGPGPDLGNSSFVWRRSEQEVLTFTLLPNTSGYFQPEQALRVSRFNPELSPSGLTIGLNQAKSMNFPSLTIEGPHGSSVQSAGLLPVGPNEYLFAIPPETSEPSLRGVEFPWDLPADQFHSAQAWTNYEDNRQCWSEVYYRYGAPPPLRLSEPLDGVTLEGVDKSSGVPTLKVKGALRGPWDGANITLLQLPHDQVQDRYLVINNLTPIEGALSIGTPDFAQAPGWDPTWNLSADFPIYSQVILYRARLPRYLTDGQVYSYSSTYTGWFPPESGDRTLHNSAFATQVLPKRFRNVALAPSFPEKHFGSPKPFAGLGVPDRP